MTTFLDGPAKGQTLMLKRTPKFLRVTEESGKWDALNELADVARPGETLHAYQIFAVSGFACGRGGCYPLARYRIVAVQPSDEIMRDNFKWAQWAQLQPSPV